MNLFDNKKYIKDFQVGEKVEAFFKVLNVSKKAKKDGSPYLALEIMDKTGKSRPKSGIMPGTISVSSTKERFTKSTAMSMNI